MENSNSKNNGRAEGTQSTIMIIRNNLTDSIITRNQTIYLPIVSLKLREESSNSRLKLSDKDRQMAASNWFLNKELLEKLSTKRLSLEIVDFRKRISKADNLFYYNGIGYFITWLDSLDKAENVRVSLRTSRLKGQCLNYAVVKS